MENENEKKVFHLDDNFFAFRMGTPPPFDDRGGQLIPFEEVETMTEERDKPHPLYKRINVNKYLTIAKQWMKTDGQKTAVVIGKIIGTVIAVVFVIAVLLVALCLYILYTIVEWSIIIFVALLAGLWDTMTTKKVSFDDWTEDKTTLPGQAMTGQATTNVQNNGGTVNVQNNFFNK